MPGFCVDQLAHISKNELSNQFLKEPGHLQDGFPVTGPVPVQDQCHNAANIEHAAFMGGKILTVQKAAEFLFFLRNIEDHPFHKKHIQIISLQGIQQGSFIHPVVEESLINDPDGGINMVVGQIIGSAVKDGMIQQGTQATFLVAEIAVKGFAGDAGLITDVTDGDGGVLLGQH